MSRSRSRPRARRSRLLTVARALRRTVTWTIASSSRENTEYSRMYADFQHIPVEEVGDLAGWLTQPPTKLVAVADPAEIPALREALAASFGDRLFLTTSLPYLLELGNPAVSKGTGIAFVAAAARRLARARRRVRGRRERHRAARRGRLRDRGRGREPAAPRARRLDLPERERGGRRHRDRRLPRLLA